MDTVPAQYVDGAICIPKSVNTLQTGSTPNRFLRCAINATSVAVEGRTPSRRKPPQPSESHSPSQLAILPPQLTKRLGIGRCRPRPVTRIDLGLTNPPT
jgi:hypothetical protein